MKFLKLDNPFVKFGLSVLKGSVITVVSVFATIGIVIAITTIVRAGSLTPPGAPGATMQTLTTLYGQVDNAYSAAYVACPSYNCSYGAGAVSCVSGWSNIGSTSQIGYVCGGNSGSVTCYVCALPR